MEELPSPSLYPQPRRGSGGGTSCGAQPPHSPTPSSSSICSRALIFFCPTELGSFICNDPAAKTYPPQQLRMKGTKGSGGLEEKLTPGDISESEKEIASKWNIVKL